MVPFPPQVLSSTLGFSRASWSASPNASLQKYLWVYCLSQRELYSIRETRGLGAWVWKGRAGVWPIPLPSSPWLRAISISPPHTLAHLQDERKNGYLADESAREANKTRGIICTVQRKTRYTLGTTEVVAAVCCCQQVSSGQTIA